MFSTFLLVQLGGVMERMACGCFVLVMWLDWEGGGCLHLAWALLWRAWFGVATFRPTWGSLKTRRSRPECDTTR